MRGDWVAAIFLLPLSSPALSLDRLEMEQGDLRYGYNFAKRPERFYRAVAGD
ncbi:hypothetical protein [Planococcus lenghuensis]|nr:hypothetical protein [Planococcus lenghuensis]